jgi:hypothetical protein
MRLPKVKPRSFLLHRLCHEMFQHAFYSVFIQPVFLAQFLSQLIRGSVAGTRIVPVEVPEEGIQSDVLFNKEMLAVVADDAVVEAALPEGMSKVSPASSRFRHHSGLECADDDPKGTFSRGYGREHVPGGASHQILCRGVQLNAPTGADVDNAVHMVWHDLKRGQARVGEMFRYLPPAFIDDLAEYGQPQSSPVNLSEDLSSIRRADGDEILSRFGIVISLQSKRIATMVFHGVFPLPRGE